MSGFCVLQLRSYVLRRQLYFFTGIERRSARPCAVPMYNMIGWGLLYDPPYDLEPDESATAKHASINGWSLRDTSAVK